MRASTRTILLLVIGLLCAATGVADDTPGQEDETRTSGDTAIFSAEITVEAQKREGMVHSRIEADEAYDLAVQGLKAAVDQYGPEAVGVFLYPDLSNEEMYLASRIAREEAAARDSSQRISSAIDATKSPWSSSACWASGSITRSP